jgi:hypothetical protein
MCVASGRGAPGSRSVHSFSAMTPDTNLGATECIVHRNTGAGGGRFFGIPGTRWRPFRGLCRLFKLDRAMC